MGRQTWASKQGLCTQAFDSAHDALVATGWMRSVGGATPYLGLFARTGLGREAIDAEVAAGRIAEMPCARGCTYVVPAADYALALALGQGHGEAASLRVAKKHLGVTEAEVDALCVAIIDAVDKGPLDPRALKEVLGDLVRHLGSNGTKRGVTTTLPLALGRLQAQARIRRIPANGRLDQQRFSYALWPDAPKQELQGAALAEALAARYLAWIGPATVTQFAWWSGLGKKVAIPAMAAVAVPVGRDAFRLIGETDVPVSDTPDVRLIGSLDNLVHLRRDVFGLIDQQDRWQPVEGVGFSTGDAGIRPVSTVLDLPHHAIVDRGRLIGLWDYDPENGVIVARMFKKTPDATSAIARTQAFIRDDLGDARAFSLDSPEARAPRLDALRGTKPAVD